MTFEPLQCFDSVGLATGGSSGLQNKYIGSKVFEHSMYEPKLVTV